MINEVDVEKVVIKCSFTFIHAAFSPDLVTHQMITMVKATTAFPTLTR